MNDLKDIARMKEPKTAADLFALPIRGGFGSIERVVNGQRVTIPTWSGERAFHAAADTILQAIDRNGQCWALCQDEEGWFRKAAR